jgi:hypothetical protein
MMNAGAHGYLLAEVPAQHYRLDSLIKPGLLFQYIRGIIAAAIVHQYYFVGDPHGRDDSAYLAYKRFDDPRRVIYGSDDR